MVYNSIIFTINPFDVVVYDDLLSEYASNIVSTLNNDLLMRIDPLVGNNIYICTAPDVLKWVSEQTVGVSIIDTINIYFPLLIKYNITSIEDLDNIRQQLLQQNVQKLLPNFIHGIESVDLLYNLSINAPKNPTYVERGIKEIRFIIHPVTKFNIPLDIIFKLIHASETAPLIKFNPSNKREKIYRLYADKIAINGKKIPFLDKGKIFKLKRTMGRTKSVSVYIEYENTNFICEFDNNGDIIITGTFDTLLDIERISEKIIEYVNPVIDIIKNYLAQNGYELENFQSFYHDSIEILQLKYVVYAKILKNIQLSKYIGCISSIFNIISSNLQKGIVMRFKRVSNYDVMNSINAFITEMINNKNTNIVDALVENFTISQEEAINKLTGFLNEIQVERNVYENKKLKIKQNPGFLTTINQDGFDNNILIQVDNINDIKYLQTIPIYLDSFIRLTQELYDNTIHNIPKLCKSNIISKEIIEKSHQDIISIGEQNKQKPATKLRFTDDATDDDNYDILDFIMNDTSSDEEENDDEDDDEILENDTKGGSDMSTSIEGNQVSIGR